MNQGQRTKPATDRTERTRFRLTGVSRAFDPRLNAIRPDLADIALAESHFAPHYAAAVPLACVADCGALHATPAATAQRTSELLFGESFNVLDVRGDWAWGSSAHDDYVGYIRRDLLGLLMAPTHRTTRRAPVFLTADIKSAVVQMLPAGSLISATPDGAFLKLADGYVHERHVTPISQQSADWVSVALQYVGQPYVWGGRGGSGIDCSGLVQMALMAAGISCPRDSDMQEATLGTSLSDGDALRRGDLVFFRGHVGIMVDEQNLLHANSHWMSTLVEPLADVVARFAADETGPIASRRRIAA